jgi:multicomponent Na+:H+ antiporter subunit G
MNVQETAGQILMFVGIAFVLLGCIGVVRAFEAIDRLHFSGLAGVTGMLFIVLGVFVANPANQAGWKALAIAALAAVLGPVVSHATARAIYRRMLAGARLETRSLVRQQRQEGRL